MPAVFQKTVEQDLHKPLKIQYCADTVFTKDNAGNQINVLLYEDGEPYSSGGTVSVTAIRADGATESWAGTISGNTVSVALTRAALDVPGTLQVFIKVTAGTVETTVYAGVYNVVCTETPTVVAPVTPSDVAALIASIEAAIRNIPADWTSFLGTIAPTFDPGKTGGYAAGDYVWYPGQPDNVGTLYRFTSAHSGTWTGTDAVTVVIGNELNDTVRYTQQVKTDAEKTVARANIGAADADDVVDLELTTVQVTPQTFDDNSKSRARSNIGAASSGDLNTLSGLVVQQGGYISDLSTSIGTVPTGETVEGQITDLKSALSESTRNINTASVGRYTTNNSGVISEGDNKVFGMSEYVPCEANTEYTVSFVDVPSLAGESFYAYYCTKDSNGTFISKLYTTISSSSGAGTFTTPANAAQIHILAYMSGGISNITGGKIQIEKGETKTQYIPPISATDYIARQALENADISGKAPKTWFIEKKITRTDMPNGGYIKTNGDFQSYGSAICSNMIPITGYTIIDAYTRLGDVGCVIAFYDEAQSFISDIKVVGNDSTALKHYIVDITGASYANAKYVRISCYNSASYDSFYCKFHAYYTDIVNGMINPLLGLKVNALGDSITSIDYTRPNWWEMISDKTGASFNNYGISGTSIAKLSDTASHGLSFVERYSDMSNDADVVMVMGGTNDGSAPLGSWDSSDITTFYGALNTLIMGLIDKYPGKPIVFCTMMRRSTDVITDNNPWETLQNKAATDTLSLQLRAEAIKHKCLQYGIPCVDIYNTSGISGLDTNDVYYRSGDQLHPSAYGQKRLAAIIMAELNKFAQFIS